MAGEAPFLSKEDLGGELAQFHKPVRVDRAAHRTLNTAFFGRGDSDQVSVTVKEQTHSFAIVPVHCELELRRALSQAEAKGSPIALLVDFDDRLPPDVSGRLAGGRLQFISRERRLCNLFGVGRIAAALAESPLAEALLALGGSYGIGKTVTTVDLATAWRLFLNKAMGLPSQDALSEEAVLDFFARRSPSANDELFFKLLDQIKGLALALEEFWGGTVGPIARLCWANWRAGRAADVAAMAFVMDALRDNQDEGAVKVFLSLRLKEFGEPKPGTQGVDWSRALADRWARLAPALSLRMGEHVRPILKRADAMVAEAGLGGVLGDSIYLTAGFAGMKSKLAAVLAAAVAKVNADGVGEVPRAKVEEAGKLYHRLSEHQLAKAPEHAGAMERALMGVRLMAYLSVRPDWGHELKDTTPIEPVFALAESYAREGGFVDWARKMVRGGNDDDSLDAAIDRVAGAADAYRDQMDRRFARALALWNGERRSGRVLPIEDALAELGVGFLKEGDRRRLLIILMDGMSWATAAELVLDVRDMHYSPLRWHPERALKMPVPMLAALPTMTEVSRAALFAGKLLAPGEETSTSRDPERVQAHKAFAKAFGDGPTLLLRGDAEEHTGYLSQKAQRLVESSERAVAVVVNALDDQLSSKPGSLVRTTVETIKPLRRLLELAREAGRAVLLIGDHGHVASLRSHNPVDVGKTENPRYREVGEDAAIDDREIVVSGNNAYTSRKSRRLAMLFGEADRYSSQRHWGEHGGASLSEVVTPALMLGSQDLRALVGEDGEALDVVAYPVPAWWHLSVPQDRKAAAPEGKMPAKPVKAKAPVPESQLSFLAVSPAPAAVPAETSKTASKWAVRLNQLFSDSDKAKKQDLVNRVIPAVELLVEHGGQLAEDVFAGSLGEAPRNVGGRVAVMAEFLNEDGYQVIEYDTAGKQVRLDLTLMQELFGQ